MRFLGNLFVIRYNMFAYPLVGLAYRSLRAAAKSSFLVPAASDISFGGCLIRSVCDILCPGQKGGHLTDGGRMMTCQQEAGLAVVVPLAGEIDMVNCEQVYDRLYAAFVSGATVVIADFTATSFCDCASLRRLLAVQRRAAAQGAQLRLVIPPGNPVQRLAELLGVNGIARSMGPPGLRPR
jgi:anti-anti-sigma factor